MARPSVLHVILKVQATNGQFNEHCLPLAGRRDITIASFLAPTLPCPPEIIMHAGTGSFRSGWRALREALRSSYDVIHVHAPQTGLILLAALGLGRSRRANCVYTVQNSYKNYRARNRVLMVPIFAAYPQIVFCSQAALASMPWWLRRLARNKAHVVPNAVDIAAIDAAIASRREPEVAAGGPLRIVVVGRLVPIKNMATVLRAVAQVSAPVDVEIIGDGPLRGELEALVEASDALRGHVTFTGLLERSEVHRRLAAADLCVSASFGEGLPVAVLEAMACRTPVLLSDIEPHREIGITRAELAVLPCEDVESFAAAISRIAAMVAHERDELGAECRRIVEDRFSIAAMHAAYVPIYDAAAKATMTPRLGLAW